MCAFVGAPTCAASVHGDWCGSAGEPSFEPSPLLPLAAPFGCAEEEARFSFLALLNLTATRTRRHAREDETARAQGRDVSHIIVSTELCSAVDTVWAWEEASASGGVSNRFFSASGRGLRLVAGLREGLAEASPLGACPGNPADSESIIVRWFLKRVREKRMKAIPI